MHREEPALSRSWGLPCALLVDLAWIEYPRGVVGCLLERMGGETESIGVGGILGLTPCSRTKLKLGYHVPSVDSP